MVVVHHVYGDNTVIFVSFNNKNAFVIPEAFNCLLFVLKISLLTLSWLSQGILAIADSTDVRFSFVGTWLGVMAEFSPFSQNCYFVFVQLPVRNVNIIVPENIAITSVPLRPINSCIGVPMYNTSKHLHLHLHLHQLSCKIPEGRYASGWLALSLHKGRFEVVWIRYIYWVFHLEEHSSLW